MDQPPANFWQYWAHVATAAALTIGGFVMRGHIRRMEEIEKAHARFVTREELERYFEKIASERRSMHEENRDRIDGLTERIDNILRDR